MLWLVFGVALLAGLFTTNRTRFAVVVFMLFTLIAGHRAFAEFDIDVGYDFEGTDVLRTSETCGRALPILLGTESKVDELGTNTRRTCVGVSRTRLLEGIGAIVVGIGGFFVGWTLIPALRPTPIDEVLNPLPVSERVEVRGKTRPPGKG